MAEPKAWSLAELAEDAAAATDRFRRSRLIEAASIALDRIRNGLAAKSLLMVGLRGVGKTVLLNRICHDAEHRGFITLLLEAPEDRSLPALLAGPLHGALLKMNRLAR